MRFVPQDPDPVLTITEAARLIGQNPAFLRRHLPKIRHYSVGGTVLLRRSALDRFLAAHVVSPSTGERR